MVTIYCKGTSENQSHLFYFMQMAAIVQLIPHMAVVLHLMNNEKAATAGARRKDLRSQWVMGHVLE